MSTKWMHKTGQFMQRWGYLSFKFFNFKGHIYKQMWLRLSGFIAKAVIQKFKKVVLLRIQPKLGIRYIDNTLVILNCSKVREKHEIINSINSDKKFTVDIGRNVKLPLLDVAVSQTLDGTMESSAYRKQSHTGKILSFYSNHPNFH